MGRVIGIRHRRKKTREGEARPTMVAIEYGTGAIKCTVCHELEDDTAELDFLMGRFPVEWRPVNSDEDISGFQKHHCKWRRAAKDEDVSNVFQHLRTVLDKKGLPVVEVMTKVPTKFDGLRKDDKVVMVLGGSGDRFAVALSRKGEDIGAKVFRLPPFSLSDNRNGEDKKDDHLTLIRIFEKELAVFYKVRQRDRDLVRVKEALIARQDAMKQRIACE